MARAIPLLAVTAAVTIVLLAVVYVARERLGAARRFSPGAREVVRS